MVRHHGALTTWEHVDRTGAKLQTYAAGTWLGKTTPDHRGPVVRVHVCLGVCRCSVAMFRSVMDARLLKVYTYGWLKVILSSVCGVYV